MSRFDGLKGDPRFFATLEKLAELHALKGQDYGQRDDIFANCRASTQFGVPSWVGTMIRANDKMVRIQSMAQKGRLANEPLQDSFMDLAAYAIIALILYEEEQ